MKYKVCDRCGSHLDYGETCECVKEAGQEERARNAENPEDQNRQVQNRLGIASPSIMSRGQEALKKAYETRRI